MDHHNTGKSRAPLVSCPLLNVEECNWFYLISTVCFFPKVYCGVPHTAPNWPYGPRDHITFSREKQRNVTPEIFGVGFPYLKLMYNWLISFWMNHHCVFFMEAAGSCHCGVNREPIGRQCVYIYIYIHTYICCKEGQGSFCNRCVYKNKISYLKWYAAYTCIFFVCEDPPGFIDDLTSGDVYCSGC